MIHQNRFAIRINSGPLENRTPIFWLQAKCLSVGRVAHGETARLIIVDRVSPYTTLHHGVFAHHDPIRAHHIG